MQQLWRERNRPMAAHLHTSTQDRMTIDVGQDQSLHHVVEEGAGDISVGPFDLNVEDADLENDTQCIVAAPAKVVPPSTGCAMGIRGTPPATKHV